jgi:exo-beta-1,3-glucanase (GH17 family)
MAKKTIKKVLCSMLIVGLFLTGCTIEGMNFSPYEGTQDPNYGDIISREQIVRKLQDVNFWTDWVRTFGVTDGLEVIGEEAHKKGKFTAIGAWLDSDLTTNQEQMDNLIALALAGHVDVAIIGNEVLLREDLTPTSLIRYMDDFRAAVPGVPVTTAEVYGELMDHPEVIDACNFVVANFYPFWEGVPIEFAMWKLNHDYENLAEIAGIKPVYVGETGWPSSGDPIGEAVPNLDNAIDYLINFLSWAEAKNVHYFYFEAFDELWKVQYEGSHAGSWGIMFENGDMKPGMINAFLGERIPDNWSGTVPGGEGEAEIYFTYVPPYGSYDNLYGQIWHVDTDTHYIAVYIKVAGGWWTKPYFAWPLTVIYPDGTWVCDVVTGGIDYQATELIAFLIPDTYDPPPLSGASSLPQELYDNCLVWVNEIRTP